MVLYWYWYPVSILVLTWKFLSNNSIPYVLVDMVPLTRPKTTTFKINIDTCVDAYLPTRGRGIAACANMKIRIRRFILKALLPWPIAAIGAMPLRVSDFHFPTSIFHFTLPFSTLQLPFSTFQPRSRPRGIYRLGAECRPI